MEKFTIEDKKGTVEICYTNEDGTVSVRYRRDEGSESANYMIKDVDAMKLRLGDRCKYFYRIVPALPIQDAADFVLPGEEEKKPFDFGDYCLIEQHFYGADSKMFLHKVIKRSKSNAWVDVPVYGNDNKEKLHDTIEPVLFCICCGVMETEVKKYKEVDCKPNDLFKIK